MPNIYITEFGSVGKNTGGTIQAPLEPPLAEQKVAFTTSTQSSTVNERARLVRIHVDADCHIAVGVNPTATANSRKLIADQTEFLSFPQGHTYKIAAYDGTS